MPYVFTELFQRFFLIFLEKLSLPSAFVYFFLVSLLVPTALKIFCSRIWNSMLVPAVCSTNPWISFKPSSTEPSRDDLANSNEVQIFDDWPITDQFRPWIFSRTSKSRSFWFFLSLRIYFTKSSKFQQDWYFPELDF